MKVILSILILFAISLQAIVDSVRAQDNLHIAANAIGIFELAGERIPVFPAVTNAGMPTERWQFRYLPLIQPERDVDSGQAVVRVENVAGLWVVSLNLRLGDVEADRRAHQLVAETFPDVPAANVSHLSPNKVEFVADFPDDWTEGSTEPIFPGTNSVIEITWRFPDEATAVAAQELLASRGSRIECTYALNARKITTNGLTVTINTLANTTLKAALEGPASAPNPGEGARVAYVRREDLRQLTSEILTDINENAYYQDPDRAASELTNKLLTVWDKQHLLSYEDFGDNKWNSTYAADDLQPDKFQKYVHDAFEYDSMKNEWKIIEGAAKSGSGGLKLGKIKLDIGGRGSSSRTYSNEGLKELFKANGIEIDIQGEIIRPKSVEVYQVNLSDFESEINLYSIDLYDKGENVQQLTKTIQPGVVNADPLNFKPLGSRVAELEKSVNESIPARFDSTVPLGTVVATVIPYEKLPENERKNWFPADGRATGDTRLKSELGIAHVPDLRGVFLRGLNSFETGQLRRDHTTKGDPEENRAVASWQGDSFKTHTSTITGQLFTADGGGPAFCYSFEPLENGVPRGDLRGNKRTKDFNAKSTGGNEYETRPRNVAVYYLIRVN